MIGATNRFPEGKLKEDDEGEIKMAVFVKDKKIIIDFGKKVAWIGLTKKEARELGETLINRADGSIKNEFVPAFGKLGGAI